MTNEDNKKTAVLLAIPVQRRSSRFLERASLEPGGLCTDCQSLHDHLSTTSNGFLQEKRVEHSVLLDMADIRQNVDEGRVGTAWIPTQCMLADAMTKYVANPQSLFVYLDFNVLAVNGEELRDDGVQELLIMTRASSAGREQNLRHVCCRRVGPDQNPVLKGCALKLRATRDIS
eukprot:1230336-Amphidinium_carterae.1